MIAFLSLSLFFALLGHITYGKSQQRQLCAFSPIYSTPCIRFYAYSRMRSHEYVNVMHVSHLWDLRARSSLTSNRNRWYGTRSCALMSFSSTPTITSQVLTKHHYHHHHQRHPTSWSSSLLLSLSLFLHCVTFFFCFSCGATRKWRPLNRPYLICMWHRVF